MSALGQKQTLGKARLMSALPPKADINPSFDHLVGRRKEVGSRPPIAASVLWRCCWSPEFYSWADVGGEESLSVKLRSRRTAILAHASASYFNLFLSAGIDARAARSRHCLACLLYLATIRIAWRCYAGPTAAVRLHPRHKP